MAFDYKKEYKEFYLPKNKPSIVTVPPMNFIAVRGQGDPNLEDGEYKAAMNLLYGVAFTIKMSKKSDRRIEGYFDYVVPPWKGSGGKRAYRALTMRIRTAFSGFPSSACPISSPGRISTGP
jgi:hypothetical protein